MVLRRRPPGVARRQRREPVLRRRPGKPLDRDRKRRSEPFRRPQPEVHQPHRPQPQQPACPLHGRGRPADRNLLAGAGPDEPPDREGRQLPEHPRGFRLPVQRLRLRHLPGKRRDALRRNDGRHVHLRQTPGTVLPGGDHRRPVHLRHRRGRRGQHLGRQQGERDIPLLARRRDLEKLPPRRIRPALARRRQVHPGLRRHRRAGLVLRRKRRDLPLRSRDGRVRELRRRRQPAERHLLRRAGRQRGQPVALLQPGHPQIQSPAAHLRTLHDRGRTPEQPVQFPVVAQGRGRDVLLRGNKRLQLLLAVQHLGQQGPAGDRHFVGLHAPGRQFLGRFRAADRPRREPAHLQQNDLLRHQFRVFELRGPGAEPLCVETGRVQQRLGLHRPALRVVHETARGPLRLPGAGLQQRRLLERCDPQPGDQRTTPPLPQPRRQGRLFPAGRAADRRRGPDHSPAAGRKEGKGADPGQDGVLHPGGPRDQDAGYADQVPARTNHRNREMEQRRNRQPRHHETERRPPARTHPPAARLPEGGQRGVPVEPP